MESSAVVFENLSRMRRAHRASAHLARPPFAALAEPRLQSCLSVVDGAGDRFGSPIAPEHHRKVPVSILQSDDMCWKA